MLLGEYEQRLDEKNRMTIPAKLRDRFEAGVFVTRGFDDCLQAFTRDGWQRFIDTYAPRLDPFTREGRSLERYLFGGATEAQMDGQGRIALPAHLVKHANLAKDIVVAGVRDRLEIWDRDGWYRGSAAFEGSAGHVAERLAHEAR